MNNKKKMKILRNLIAKFKPTQNLYLGRWRLKHDQHKCENYLLNYYGEPGYPNKFKQEWISKSKK